MTLLAAPAAAASLLPVRTTNYSRARAGGECPWRPHLLGVFALYPVEELAERLIQAQSTSVEADLVDESGAETALDPADAFCACRLDKTVEGVLVQPRRRRVGSTRGRCCRSTCTCTCTWPSVGRRRCRSRGALCQLALQLHPRLDALGGIAKEDGRHGST